MTTHSISEKESKSLFEEEFQDLNQVREDKDYSASENLEKSKSSNFKDNLSSTKMLSSAENENKNTDDVDNEGKVEADFDECEIKMTNESSKVGALGKRQHDNGIGAGHYAFNFDDIAAFNLHHYNLMHPFHSSENLCPDASKLLKGILQNREAWLKQQIPQKLQTQRQRYIEQRAVTKMLTTGTLPNSSSFMDNLYGSHPRLGSEQMEPEKSSPQTGSPYESADDLSDQENDNEFELMDRNESNDGEKDEDEEEKEKTESENGSQDKTNGDYPSNVEESKDVKRARVENIITSMRTQSSQDPDGAVTSPQENRRKRKQSQPQQHEASKHISGEHQLKYRKVQCDQIGEQLKQMQRQLQQMYQQYAQLYTQNAEQAGLFEVDDIPQVKSSPIKDNFENHKDTIDPTLLKDEMTRRPYNKSKEEKVMSASYKSDAMPENLQELANTLKSEFVRALDDMVDSIVSKVLAKNKSLSLKKVAGGTGFSSNGSHHPQDQQQKQSPQQQLHRPQLPYPQRDDRKLSPMVTLGNEVQRPFELPQCKVTEGHRANPERFPRGFLEIPRPIPVHGLYPHPFYYHHTQVPTPTSIPLPPREPEQTEALPLLVTTPPPKKKRTKVTDTRLSPRAARALLQEPVPHQDPEDKPAGPSQREPYHSMIPSSLPTSVAIPNPSLQHSDVMSLHSYGEHNGVFYHGNRPQTSDHSPPIGDHSSPSLTAHTPTEGSMPRGFHMKHEQQSDYTGSPHSDIHSYDNMQLTSTLTPMHLRKAKLMFFYVRYPSSAILKIYFPDIRFNKSNTAQLVKWFSNFREILKVPPQITQGWENYRFRVIS
ncbi:homeobox protein prospero isoform X2 [Lingula anatina]|uniref:Homeobox protein prospero isoform X2 n=1 Tax=Lingula anatina TaxID=7574 RepID=A0A1S3J9Y1_LINAN|nr:homeobox protein prospero isoform X2 [Lingula anatina]|eukprot:XP_013407212.1 homeobox protein prospero isoform X2 [Lingula anatina]